MESTTGSDLLEKTKVIMEKWSFSLEDQLDPTETEFMKWWCGFWSAKGSYRYIYSVYSQPMVVDVPRKKVTYKVCKLVTKLLIEKHPGLILEANCWNCWWTTRDCAWLLHLYGYKWCYMTIIHGGIWLYTIILSRECWNGIPQIEVHPFSLLFRTSD